MEAPENPHVAPTATETRPGRCSFIFIVILSTIPSLVTGGFIIRTLFFLKKGDPDCTNPHLDWELWFEIFLLVVFLVALIGVLFKIVAVQIICLTLLGITILTIILTVWSIERGGTFDNDNDPKRIEAVYRLEGYAPWARKFLLKDSGWNAFQNCLIERKICDKLGKRDFYQEGCCIPPPYCGYKERNQTWVIPKTSQYADDVNCVRWDSDKRKLCFDCETCQAVYVGTMDNNWRLRGVSLNFGTAIWVVCLCFASAFKNQSRVRAVDNRSV
ncbi:hypothetical protein Vadar_011879 [Vaccinium darrowii]|uniref:Uncharacterized protein n=1 Tax=Vaccinium darrowii TaxID=229202 RepID=A0ACB7YE62_9ERIC|nr:hypothetical protein Vadar_011879 [Vaccinium darrowii]